LSLRQLQWPCTSPGRRLRLYLRPYVPGAARRPVGFSAGAAAHRNPRRRGFRRLCSEAGGGIVLTAVQERATNAAVTNADEVMTPTVFRASVPVTLELPLSMAEAVAEVLGGSYDAPYSGAGLTILDIGAHVGAFTLWANMRWPGSQIFAYEPQPQTFASLQRNTSQLPDVTCVRAAVYPSRQEKLWFYSRFAGDGEAGVVDVLQRIFNSLPEQEMVEVPVLHPADLPRADIVKIDTEGAEAAILEAMDLQPVSLIILQYHFV